MAPVADGSRDAHSGRRHQQERHFRGFVWTGDDPRYRKVWRYLDNLSPGWLLDVGCGNGAFCGRLVLRGWRCFGVELVPDIAQEAYNRGIFVTLSDAADGLPLLDSRFDVVFAGEIIEHMVDDDHFISECFRVIKPGGMLILTTPNLVSLGNRLLMSLGKMPRYAYRDYHYRIYNLHVLLEKLRAGGFTPLRVESSHLIISKSSPRRILSRAFGNLGEFLGSVFPRLGEMFVVTCAKR